MGDVGEAFEAMNEHKGKERELKEPSRFEYAKQELDKLGVSNTKNGDFIIVKVKSGRIDFYPFTGWFCGRKPLGNIKGRGIVNLIASLKGFRNGVPLI